MNDVSYNLRPVWDALLDIYETFAAYCEKFHLRYYVTGGTLLGAVRHDGFIPWDDDFDVVMPRQDYRKFFDVVANELPSNLQAVDFHNPRMKCGFSGMFGKLYDIREGLSERISEASRLKLSQGVFIDIIPIDGMPRSTLGFYYWALKRSAWRHRNERSFRWRIASWLLNCRGTDVDFERWLSSYDYDTSPCVEDYNAKGSRLKQRALTGASFGEPVWHKFDRTTVPLPREYEKFLRCVFGQNYMQLPPEEQRYPSHQIVI